MRLLDDYSGPGVYAIIDTKTYKWYIGSGINVKRRYKEHKSRLRHERHANKHLQSAWNKYGEDNFVFKLISKVNAGNLLFSEQYWIDFFNVCDDTIGYNICPVAGNTLGRKCSQEAKRKISRAHKGKILTKQHRKAIGKSLRGLKRSEEFRQKHRLANLGQKNPQAKLTPQNVIEIKELLKKGVYQKDIAHKFGVCRAHIGAIGNRKRWKHIQI